MDYTNNTWQAFHYQNNERQDLNVSLDIPPYYRYVYPQNDSIVWLTPLESNNRMQSSLVKLNTNTLQCSQKIKFPTDTAVVYSYLDKVIDSYKDGLFIYHKIRKMLLLLNQKHAVHRIDFKKPIRQAFLKDEKTLLVLSGNELYSVDLDTKQQHLLLSHSHALVAALYHQNALFAVDATG